MIVNLELIYLKYKNVDIKLMGTNFFEYLFLYLFILTLINSLDTTMNSG